MDREMILIQMFCDIDNFCNQFEPKWNAHLLANGSQSPKSSLYLSEIITIVAFYHHSGYKTFKHYFNLYIKKYLKIYFPKLVSYNRFVELIKSIIFPIFCFLRSILGTCTGLSFIDSTPLKVCHNLRIKSNKVFKDVAKRGKSSTGWFFGFKLHIVVNECGELLAWMLTPGNIDDRKPVPELSKDLFGKLFGDKGYLSTDLFKELFDNGVHLFTKIKSNMKNRLMHIVDKILLRRRGLVDSVNAVLKEECNIEHSRHRSIWNFLVHTMGALVAYCYRQEKPSLNISKSLFKRMVE
jgi:Transposase DDE domain